MTSPDASTPLVGQWLMLGELKGIVSSVEIRREPGSFPIVTIEMVCSALSRAQVSPAPMKVSATPQQMKEINENIRKFDL